MRGLSCSAACGIFLEQGLNPCLLHWQVDSLLLSHQGSPQELFLETTGTPQVTVLSYINTWLRLRFLQIERLWQTCIEQDYLEPFFK